MRTTGKSISVSVRVVRAVRAGGRGEAAWERECRDDPSEARGRRAKVWPGGGGRRAPVRMRRLCSAAACCLGLHTNSI